MMQASFNCDVMAIIDTLFPHEGKTKGTFFYIRTPKIIRTSKDEYAGFVKSVKVAINSSQSKMEQVNKNQVS